MTPQEDYDFLNLTLPENQGASWANWSRKAKLVNPQSCLKVLRRPEPYLTQAHEAAMLTLRQHDWKAATTVRNGSTYFEYCVPDGQNWKRIFKNSPTPKSAVVKEIIDSILDGYTVFAIYENPDNKTGIPIYTKNVLKLVPAGFRKFQRFWRNNLNDAWMLLGDFDKNCDVEFIRSETHVGIMTTEFDAILHVAKWLQESKQKEAEFNRIDRIAKERELEQQRLEKLFPPSNNREY